MVRKMDILNADLYMKDEAVTDTTNRRKKRHTKEEAAFHFNAFVPFEGKLWKLDGLERQPQNLGRSYPFLPFPKTNK
jgi:ubiquitin carboxyl-terminal hydrolase L5